MQFFEKKEKGATKCTNIQLKELDRKFLSNNTMEFRTSRTHPLLITFVDVDQYIRPKHNMNDEMNMGKDSIGFSMLPGRNKIKRKWTWERDLEQDIEVLRTMNIKCVVSLITDKEFDSSVSTSKGDFVQKLEKVGISHIHYPIVDKYIPPDIDSCMELIEKIVYKMLAGDKCLIHCNGGKGRSALITALVCLVLINILPSMTPIDTKKCEKCYSFVRIQYLKPSSQKSDENAVTNTEGILEGRKILIHSLSYSTCCNIILHIKQKCKGALRNPLQICYCILFIFWFNHHPNHKMK